MNGEIIPNKENMYRWMQEVAACVMQVNGYLSNDDAFHSGNKSIAIALVSNASKTVGDMYLQGKYAEMKSSKLISRAVEKALDLATADRRPTNEEIAALMEVPQLKATGFTTDKYAEIEARFANQSRKINDASVQAIRLELETLKSLDA